MKSRYTIGEVASLLNISQQTLRYYDKMNVVVPSYIDQNSGYRYYTYDQIQYIDRVKYLQAFGCSLDDIRSALESNNIKNFQKFLFRRRQEIRNESKQLQRIEADLDWYLQYFSHIDYQTYNQLPFRTEEPERFLLAEPIGQNESIYGFAGYRLTQLQHSGAFEHVHFLRQNGYLLNYERLCKGQIVPTHYFIFLREDPGFSHPNIHRIPAGTFFCQQAKILTEPFNGSLFMQYLKRQNPSPLVLANEYEDNFTNFQNCIYEIQVYQKIDNKYL